MGIRNYGLDLNRGLTITALSFVAALSIYFTVMSIIEFDKEGGDKTVPLASLILGCVLVAMVVFAFIGYGLLWNRSYDTSFALDEIILEESKNNRGGPPDNAFSVFRQPVHQHLAKNFFEGRGTLLNLMLPELRLKGTQIHDINENNKPIGDVLCGPPPQTYTQSGRYN